MGKLNGLNQIKSSGIIGKNIVLKSNNEKTIASGKIIELWYHEEDTGVDIVLDTDIGFRTYMISFGYLEKLIEEYK
jgi:hypothetical protein